MWVGGGRMCVRGLHCTRGHRQVEIDVHIWLRSSRYTSHHYTCTCTLYVVPSLHLLLSSSLSLASLPLQPSRAAWMTFFPVMPSIWTGTSSMHSSRYLIIQSSEISISHVNMQVSPPPFPLPPPPPLSLPSLLPASYPRTSAVV